MPNKIFCGSLVSVSTLFAQVWSCSQMVAFDSGPFFSGEFCYFFSKAMRPGWLADFTFSLCVVTLFTMAFLRVRSEGREL